MRTLVMIVREGCPYCARAQEELERIRGEDRALAEVEIVKVKDDSEDLPEKCEYFYAPAFFIDGKKIAEGAYEGEKLREILCSAYNS